MTLVPALFTLLGEKTWYMPRWLDRLLPKVTIEPPHNGEIRPPRPTGLRRRREPGQSEA
jgi:RND superfamily putative drug exporter